MNDEMGWGWGWGWDGMGWDEMRWDNEHVVYGGSGTPDDIQGTCITEGSGSPTGAMTTRS